MIKEVVVRGKDNKNRHWVLGEKEGDKKWSIQKNSCRTY